MPDRENVITHLQIIRTWSAFASERDLQFFTAKHLEDIVSCVDDALAILKKDEHKNSFTVIDKHTGEYPNVQSIAIRCKWAKNLIYCDIDQFVIGEDGTLMLTDDCGNVAYCPADRFEVIWDACQNVGKGYCGERMDN